MPPPNDLSQMDLGCKFRIETAKGVDGDITPELREEKARLGAPQ